VLGSGAMVWLGTAVALSLHRRTPWPLLHVATTALATFAVVTALKLIVRRDRPPAVVLEPEPLLEVPTTSSFPSGHAASSFACAYVLARFAPRLAIPLFVLAAGIAFSRVYTGVHYPLDVTVGAVLGLVVATALLRLLRDLRRSRPAPPPG